MSYRAIRFQLRLTPAQERTFSRWAGMGRWVWNQALARQKSRYEAGEPYAGYVDMAKWLTQWRNTPQTAWLREGPVHTQQQVLRRLDAAFQRFFANVRAGKRPGYPRFKTRGSEPGLRFPDKAQIGYDAANGRVRLPKIGWLRLRHSMQISTGIANATVTREGKRWVVSLQYTREDAAPHGLAPTLGLDMGVANFYADSDGACEAPLRALARQARRLAYAQRAVARKRKGSRNRRKAVDRLAALHRRIARQRNAWLHGLSTALSHQHPAIAIEDLKVAAMSASARGTVQAPGRKVRQKAGLNRSILDQGWSTFRTMLAYKLAAQGGELIAVAPAYTSQRCHQCGHTARENRPTQAKFTCMACGHAEHADVNAAQNILAAGHAVWAARDGRSRACGEAVRQGKQRVATRATSVKQEPTEAGRS